MLPFLKVLANGSVRHTSDIRNELAGEFGLKQEDIAERIPSGQSTVLDNRTGWARTYLKKAGLIEPVARGHYRIAARGLEVLKSKPTKIDAAFLKQFPEFIDFISPKDDAQTAGIEAVELSPSQTPLEVLESAYQGLRRELADELLQTVRAAAPSFFEHLVVDLLVAWVTVDRGRTPVKQLAGRAMTASTELSKRTDWAY